MNRPSIFISCVSREFRQTRSRVADILTRLGYTPVIQEIFGTEPGDLRQVLRNKIDACDGLIQIIGHGYGAEPPMVDANYGRVSYTQFEFLYARTRKKKTWLVFAGDACTRDTPPDRLDLLHDPAHPDPAAYQAERCALQLAYSDKRWEPVLELPDRLRQPLPSEKKVGEVFSDVGALLIMGEPGAGKTVTLLELARNLLDRFEVDPGQPLPVVLHLSFWREARGSRTNSTPFSIWVEAEMKDKYSVPARRTRLGGPYRPSFAAALKEVKPAARDNAIGVGGCLIAVVLLWFLIMLFQRDALLRIDTYKDSAFAFLKIALFFAIVGASRAALIGVGSSMGN